MAGEETLTLPPSNRHNGG